MKPYVPKPTSQDDHSGQRSLVRKMNAKATEYIDFNADGGVEKEEYEEIANHPMDVEPDHTQRKTKFFSKDASDLRKKFYKTYPIIIITLCVYFLAVFSIYWGSLFHRTKRLVNINILVSVEDDPTGFVSESLVAATNVTQVKEAAGWQVQSYIPPDKIKDLVHRQKYWGAVYVSGSNISSIFEWNLATNGTFEFNSTANAYYETGNDLVGVSTYVRPTMFALGTAFEQIIRLKAHPKLLAGLNSTQYSAIRNNPTLSSIPPMSYTDGNPLTNPILMAPMQIGMIYIIIVCFFQSLLFVKINIQIGSRLTSWNYLAYRMILPQTCYMFLALIYSCLNRAFQIDFNRTWNGGFVIFWMFSFLIMSACGGACENAATVVGAISPAFTGFWMMFFICINIAATYSPIEVCPKIFRYTYAMPIRAGYDLLGILFMNAYKGKLGLYIGILVAWIAINNVLLPFCLIFAGYRLKKFALKKKQKQEFYKIDQ